jgi:hypothetical protein
MNLTERLAQSKFDRENAQICKLQQSLHAPIERAHNEGKISEEQYRVQMNAANEKIRTYTRELAAQ